MKSLLLIIALLLLFTLPARTAQRRVTISIDYILSDNKCVDEKKLEAYLIEALKNFPDCAGNMPDDFRVVREGE